MEHYNLYWIFREEKDMFPLSEERSKKILKKIEKVFIKNKTFADLTTPNKTEGQRKCCSSEK